ncbi:MAG TPA: helix-turn-helix domain-containing protein [Frankiaceae bacterium]|nr:helix-turn-helix domain-containing protein [Frankiaceae bacterium]
MAAPNRDGLRPTLGAVVASISTLRIVCAPLGPNVPVADVRLADDAAVGRDDLVLAGTDDARSLVRVVSTSAAAGAAAVAVPRHATTLTPAAYDLGVALLQASGPWGDLYRTTTRAVAPAPLPEPPGAVTVAAFEPLRAGQDPEVVRNLVWYLATLRRPGTRAVVEAGVCYAVVPGDDVAGLAATVARRAGIALGAELRAGVGSTLSGPGRAAASRDDADRVLDVLRDRPDLGPVASIDDVRPQVAVASIGSLVARWPLLRLPQLALLRGHDEAHDTGYVATLAAYLATFGDTALAAARLGVHPNTFRYRLRRLVELTGLDLDDPGQRLACELELAVRA